MEMKYGIVFPISTPGAESIEALRAKVLLMQQQYKTAGDEVKKSVKAILDAQKEANQASVEGNQSRARSQAAAAATERAALDGLIAKQREVKAALDEISTSQARMMSGSMAATSAMRELQGGIPTRALGSFLANTLGLGATFQTLIPVIGLVAGGMELLRLTTGKSSDKTKELAEAMKDLDKAYRSTADSIERYKEQRDKADKGPGAARADAAAYDAKKQHNLELQLGGNEKDIDALYRQVAGPRFGSGSINRDSVTLDQGRADQVSLLRVKSADLKRELTELKAKRAADQAEARHDDSKPGEELAKKRAATEHEAQHFLEEAQARELTGYNAIHAKIQAIIDLKAEENSLDQKSFDLYVRAATAENLKYSGTLRALVAKEWGAIKPEASTGKFERKEFSGELSKGIKADEVDVAGLRRIISASDQADVEGVRRSTEATVHGNARGVQGGSMSAGTAANSDLQARVTAAQKIYDIETKGLDVKKLDADLAKVAADQNFHLDEQEWADAEKLANARKQWAQELYEASAQNEEGLQALHEKDLEKFKSLAGSVFDALASRRPGALTDLLRTQVLSIGKGLVEHVAGQAWPTIQKAIPQAKALGGLLGHDDPLSHSATNLDGSARNLSDAAAKLAAAAHGGAGNSVSTQPGGGVPGSGGAVSGGAASDSAGVTGDIGDGLPMASDPWGAGSAAASGAIQNSAPGAGFGMNAGTIGMVAAATAGTFAAVSGFKKGGAGGALQGTSAILGTAALFDPEPISKAVLAGAAIVTGLISGFVNNPQKRANTINTELGQDQYIAPTAMNVTQSSGGTFADFDAKGNLRTSNFSPYPTVTEGYTWEQTHGLFGPPPTFYDVPGGQKSQFGAPEAPPAPVVQHIYHISTMDSQSFNDFAQKNHMAIGNAAAHNIQQVEGRLASEIDKRGGR